jgi:hypothetical protein
LDAAAALGAAIVAAYPTIEGWVKDEGILSLKKTLKNARSRMAKRKSGQTSGPRIVCCRRRRPWAVDVEE